MILQWQGVLFDETLLVFDRVVPQGEAWKLEMMIAEHAGLAVIVLNGYVTPAAGVRMRMIASSSSEPLQCNELGTLLEPGDRLEVVLSCVHEMTPCDLNLALVYSRSASFA